MKYQTWTFINQRQSHMINSQSDDIDIRKLQHRTSNSRSHEHQASIEQTHHNNMDIRQSDRPTRVNYQHDFITTQLD